MTPNNPTLPVFIRQAAPTSVTVPYFPGVDYGVGIDSPSGSARNVAVTGLPTSIPNAAGTSYNYFMDSLNTMEDLQTALGISASVNGGVGLFKASAEFNFAQSCDLNSSYAFMYVSIQVTNAFEMIKQPGISDAAAQLLAQGNDAAFQLQFGDLFVRGIQTGGTFLGVIQVETTSETDKTNIKAALSGAYGPFGASGTFTDEFKQTMSQRSFLMKIHSAGGDTPSKLITSMDDLVAVAGSWPLSVPAKAVPFTALMDDYGVLALPFPPNFINLQQQRDVLTQCSMWRDADLQTLNDITFIKDNPSQFIGVNSAQLDQIQTTVSQDLNTLAAAASTAINSPDQAQLPVLHLPPPVQLPRRIVTPTVAGVSPAGGPATGGNLVIVSGSAFTGATGVTFGAAAATNVTIVGDTEITVTAPPHIGAASPSGTTVDVTVTGPTGTSDTSTEDKYTYAPAAPIVTGVAPDRGQASGGVAVTVTGTGLTGATQVTFGSAAGTNLTVVSDTAITVTAPANTSSATVDVTVTTPVGTSVASPADRFTYAPPPPVVTGVTPATGPAAGGTAVTVTGSALTGAARVDFGTAAATNLVVLSDTEITATTPPNSGAATVDTVVTTPAGVSAPSPADRFTYQPPPLVLFTGGSQLPAAVCGTPYSQQLQATGGFGALRWAMQSGTLPAGLVLSPEGVISGVAVVDQTAPGPVVLTITDSAGQTTPSPQLTIHLIGRRDKWGVFNTTSPVTVDQDSSGNGDITHTYRYPPPEPGTIDTSSVFYYAEATRDGPVYAYLVDANSGAKVSGPTISPDAVTFTIHTVAANLSLIGGHHSGELKVWLGFTYFTK